MMSSYLLTVVPITVENVKPVMEKIRYLQTLCVYLDIPRSNRDNAATAADYFANQIMQYRWRMMIYCLDTIGDTQSLSWRMQSL